MSQSTGYGYAASADAPTPEAMLKLFRAKMDSFTNIQAQMFLEMKTEEQLELLFYMLMSTNATLQFVHSLIDPSVVESSPMPEPPKGH